MLQESLVVIEVELLVLLAVDTYFPPLFVSRSCRVATCE